MIYALQRELCLQDDESWKEKGTLFLPKDIVTKMCFTKLSP